MSARGNGAHQGEGQGVAKEQLGERQVYCLGVGDIKAFGNALLIARCEKVASSWCALVRCSIYFTQTAFVAPVRRPLMKFI
eukprot:6201208-Pleurochrysis_carterae.AAC.1